MTDPLTDPAAEQTPSDEMQVFLDRVRVESGEAARRAGTPDLELERLVDAEILARSTMRALGESLTHTQAEHLTASLPEELGSELLAHAIDVPSGFDRDAFHVRVATEIGPADAEAADHDDHADHVVAVRVRIVLVALRGWAPTGQLEGTLAQLPRPLADMFA